MKYATEMINLFESSIKINLSKIPNLNYTDYMEKCLKEYFPTHKITKPTGAFYKSGKYFEKIFYFWHYNVLGFCSKEEIIDMFNMEGRWICPGRIIEENVPYYTTINLINVKKGKTIRKNEMGKTEFVTSVKDAIPTEEFPLSSFNDDSSLVIRNELKTQNVGGTAYKKNAAIIPELIKGSPEKNIIFLMTGIYQNEDWYEEAKYFASKAPSGKIVRVMNEKEYVEWSLRAFPIVK